MMAITVILKAAAGTCREERSLRLCETKPYDVIHQTGGIYLTVIQKEETEMRRYRVTFIHTSDHSVL